MLTIEEIKKALDAGETVELECIDREGYEGEHRLNCTLLKTARLIVQEIGYCRVIIKNTDASTQITDIDRDELKYFRIKRPTPTFDDLIDVAVKAFKDGILGKVNMNDIGVRELRYKLKDEDSDSIVFEQHNDYSDGVDFINSLYTETFVIESEEDVMRSKIDSITKLTNGQELQCRSSNLLIYRDENDRTVKLSFCILKGATVTQKRGAI